MFWPPTFTPNVRVTISDSLVGVPRFATYAQDATCLSPWLSWATIDTRWNPSDPMARFLLKGQPPSPLFSLNADGQGAVIQLGDPPVGRQGWEVVSFFDWYVAVLKVGAFAWCRLTPPAVQLPPTPIMGCHECPAGAAPRWQFTMSGLVSSSCTTCENANGTWVLSHVPGTCKFRSSTFTICGLADRYWELEAFATGWALTIGPSGPLAVTLYRRGPLSWNCFGPNLMPIVNWPFGTCTGAPGTVLMVAAP